MAVRFNPQQIEVGYDKPEMADLNLQVGYDEDVTSFTGRQKRKLQEAISMFTGGVETLGKSFLPSSMRRDFKPAQPDDPMLNVIGRRLAEAGIGTVQDALSVLGIAGSPIQAAVGPTIGAGVEHAAAPYAGEDIARLLGTGAELTAPLGVAALAKAGKISLGAGKVGAVTRALTGAPEELGVRAGTMLQEGPLAADQFKMQQLENIRTARGATVPGQPPGQVENILRQRAPGMQMQLPGEGMPLQPPLTQPDLFTMPEAYSKTSPLSEVAADIFEVPRSQGILPLEGEKGYSLAKHIQKVTAFNEVAGRVPNPAELKLFPNIELEQVQELARDARRLADFKAPRESQNIITPLQSFEMKMADYEKSQLTESLGATTLARQGREAADAAHEARMKGWFGDAQVEPSFLEPSLIKRVEAPSLAEHVRTEMSGPGGLTQEEINSLSWELAPKGKGKGYNQQSVDAAHSNLIKATFFKSQVGRLPTKAEMRQLAGMSDANANAFSLELGGIRAQEALEFERVVPRPGQDTLAGMMAGSFAGFKPDEEGNYIFDPTSALLGTVAGAAGLTLAARLQSIGPKIRQFQDFVKKSYAGRSIPTRLLNDFDGTIQRGFIFPHTLAERYPQLFGPMHDSALRFFERRSVIGSEAQAYLGDVLKEGVSTRLKSLMVHGSIQGREYTAPQLAALGFGNKEIQQYTQVRNSMEYVLDRFHESLLRTGTDPQEAATFINQWKRTGFVPIKRFGKYYVAVEDSAGNLIRYSMAESKAAHNVDKTELQVVANQLGGTLVAGEVAKQPYSMMQGMDIGVLSALSKVATEVQSMIGGQQLPLQLTKLLAKAQVSGAGYPMHLLKQTGVGGFKLDEFEKGLASYIRSAAQYISRREARAVSAPLLEQIQAAQKPQLWDYAKKYMDEVVNPTGDMGWLRESLFHYYLAGKVSSAFVNLTGHATMAYPVIGRYSSKAAVQWTRGIKDAFKADAQLAPEIAAGLRQAQLEGIVGDPTTQQILGTASGRPAFLRGASDLAGAMFGSAEKAIRRATYISGQNIARGEHGLTGIDAHDFAKKLVREANLDYTKADRPMIIRSGIAAPLGTFRLFSWNVMSKFYNAAKNGEWGTLARHLGTLGAVAGITGMPGAQLVIEGARKLGYDIPLETRKKFGRTGEIALKGPAIAAGALWGQPDQGIDLSGSAGIGDLVPKEVFSSPGAGISKALLGVVADPFERAARAGKLYGQGETSAAVKTVLPQAAQSLMTAIQGAQTGEIRTAFGEPVYKPTPFDLTAKGLGFQPSGLSQAYERETSERQLRSLVSGNSEQFYRHIARAIVDGDMNAYSDAIDGIRAFNERAIPAARIYIGTPQAKAAIRRHILAFRRPELAEMKTFPKRARGEFMRIQEAYD